MSVFGFFSCNSRQVLGCLLTSLLCASAVAQQDFSQVEIKTIPVAAGVYMLVGEGGNIGLSIGDDGVFIVDDQYAPLTDRIREAIAALTDRPIRFVINTHWHFDHTGGNENLGKAGASIVAHDNVRERMLKGQAIEAFDMVVPPAPKEALPVITFDEAVTFHWNGDTLEVIHPAPAHTDGDAVIYFDKANVVHTGDVYWNGFYPFIDASSGGSTAGVIDGIAAILARIDSDTRVIPGHGPLSNRAELQAYHDMLKTVHARIKALKEQGKTLEEIVAEKPTADYDAEWGDGFFSPDQWVKVVYPTI